MKVSELLDDAAAYWLPPARLFLGEACRVVGMAGVSFRLDGLSVVLRLDEQDRWMVHLSYSQSDQIETRLEELLAITGACIALARGMED